MTVRDLAASVGVTPAHLSRTIHGGKRASVDLMRRVALALGKADDYFTEVRLAIVVQGLERDPALVEKLYVELPIKARRSAT
jgi:transcriptional regulator with XRE-family HTH domain